MLRHKASLLQIFFFLDEVNGRRIFGLLGCCGQGRLVLTGTG